MLTRDLLAVANLLVNTIVRYKMCYKNTLFVGRGSVMHLRAVYAGSPARKVRTEGY